MTDSIMFMHSRNSRISLLPQNPPVVDVWYNGIIGGLLPQDKGGKIYFK
jgi:hypothetical protein